ncbi:nicolin-1 [Pogona vitticeps]
MLVVARGGEAAPLCPSRSLLVPSGRSFSGRGKVARGETLKGSGASGRMGTMAHEPAPCTVKSPVALQVGDMRTELGRPGVLVVDVVLPHSQTVDLHEIVFKNYYTAFLTLRVQRRNPADGGEESPSKWVTCLRNYRLMPNPHTEEGSQDYFSLSRHQMLCDVDRVAAMRFILRQPSPVWLHFTIEELQLFPGSQKSPQKGFPAWLSYPSSQEPPTNLHDGLPDADKVSSEVQQMWVLTEMLQTNQPATRIGRFDVDGSYDLNLLSYT